MKRLLLLFILCHTCSAMAEDGSRLWLRYPDARVEPASISLREKGSGSEGSNPIVQTAISELTTYWQGLPVTLCLGGDEPLAADAFRITKVDEQYIRLAASNPAGLLYGAYFMLRWQTMGDGCLCQSLGPSHDLVEQPASPKRSVAVVDPSLLSGRATTLARALASVGVNEVVCPIIYINNVENLADTLRPYGITLKLADADNAPVLPLTSDTNWTGSHLQQFDIYAAARSQWQPDLTPVRMVCEWLAQTFSQNPYFIISMRDAMLDDTETGMTRLFDTWQEMHSYVDQQRYEEVETWIIRNISDRN